MSGEKVATDRITRALVDYHMSKSRPPIVWEETEATIDGNRRCRFDVLTADVLAGHRLRLRAWEIKTSVADFRADVEDEKSRKYLEAGASCVSYVVPKGMVAKSECPSWAGLATWNPDTGSFRTVQKAPVEIRPIPESLYVRLILRKNEQAVADPAETRSERMARYRRDLRLGYWLDRAAARLIHDAERVEDRVAFREANLDRAQRELDARLERARLAAPVTGALADLLQHLAGCMSPSRGIATDDPTRNIDEFLEACAAIVPERYGSHWRPKPSEEAS